MKKLFIKICVLGSAMFLFLYLIDLYSPETVRTKGHWRRKYSSEKKHERRELHVFGQHIGHGGNKYSHVATNKSKTVLQNAAKKNIESKVRSVTNSSKNDIQQRIRNIWLKSPKTNVETAVNNNEKQNFSHVKPVVHYQSQDNNSLIEQINAYIKEMYNWLISEIKRHRKNNPLSREDWSLLQAFALESFPKKVLTPSFRQVDFQRFKSECKGKVKEVLNKIRSTRPGEVSYNNVLFFPKDYDQSDLDINPAENQKKPKIPHIIHQTWDTYDVPSVFIPWIKSVIRHHPKWEYWFWTQKDVQCFLKYRYSKFQRLYNSYYSTIFRTDVMRYFLLYDVGGVYLDLDVEALKPMDPWTYMSSSVLSHETYEHSFLSNNINTPNIMTTILATKPGHQYYKMLQENLDQYHRLYGMDVLRSTGPYFMESIFQKYIRSYDIHENNFGNTTKNKFNIHNNDDNKSITVIPPKYWLPTFDKLIKEKVVFYCDRSDWMFPNTSRIHNMKLKVCEKQKKESYKNKPDKQAFLNHHWLHANLQNRLFKQRDLVNLHDVIPDLKSVSDRLGLTCS